MKNCTYYVSVTKSREIVCKSLGCPCPSVTMIVINISFCINHSKSVFGIDFIFLVINTYTLFCQKLLQSKNVMNKFRWFVSSMHCFNVFISSFDPVLFLAMFGHSILSHILIVTVSEKAKKVTNSRLPSQCGNCGNSHTFLENRESN